jgi:hypothetical protein
MASMTAALGRELAGIVAATLSGRLHGARA